MRLPANHPLHLIKMINKKGFELAMSTLIILILGIIVLIGLILVFTGALDVFKDSTEPFLDTARSSSIKQACSLACENSDALTYCCEKYSIDEKEIECSDQRLQVSCEKIKCESIQCE